MKEYKDIPGYEGLYKINEEAAIFSVPRKQKAGGFIKLHQHRKGYIIAYLCKNNETKTIKVHRLVALTFIPNPYNKPFVNHINGIKTDNRVDNLEWCTQSENIIHSFKTGLASQSGFNNNRSSIKDLDTLNAIISDWNSRCYSQLNLAKKYGISQATVSNIVTGKSYGLIEKGLALDATKFEKEKIK